MLSKGLSWWLRNRLVVQLIEKVVLQTSILQLCLHTIQEPNYPFYLLFWLCSFINILIIVSHFSVWTSNDKFTQNDNSVTVYSPPCWWKHFWSFVANQGCNQSTKQCNQMGGKTKTTEKKHRIAPDSLSYIIQVIINPKIPNWFRKMLLLLLLLSCHHISGIKWQKNIIYCYDFWDSISTNKNTYHGRSSF